MRCRVDQPQPVIRRRATLNAPSSLPPIAEWMQAEQSSGDPCRVNAKLYPPITVVARLTGRSSTLGPLHSSTAVSGILGGFNRSSQHFSKGGCDGSLCAGGSSPRGPARGLQTVLGCDC